MINQGLQALGLNPTEISVYLAVTAHGRLSHAAIGKITGVNRTTVYSTIDQLRAKGLVAEDLGTRPTKVVALPPDQLTTLVDNEARLIEAKHRTARTAAEALTKLAKQAEYSVPRIVFVDYQQLEQHLYRQAEIWSASITERDPEKAWWGYQDHSFVENAAYRAWIDWYWTAAVPKTVQLKLLSNESDIEKQMRQQHYARRHIRFWDQADEFTATTWINGDYVVMIYTRSQPHYLVEIHDQAMAHNFRQLFKGIWQSLKPSKDA